jgi:hypothetical protein
VPGPRRVKAAPRTRHTAYSQYLLAGRSYYSEAKVLTPEADQPGRRERREVIEPVFQFRNRVPPGLDVLAEGVQAPVKPRIVGEVIEGAGPNAACDLHRNGPIG